MDHGILDESGERIMRMSFSNDAKFVANTKVDVGLLLKIIESQNQVLEWVSKYETGNDPECLTSLKQSFQSYCQEMDAIEKSPDWKENE